jgi:hypothetical protein
MDAAALFVIDWTLGTTLVAKFGTVGQDDASDRTTHFDCAFPLASMINFPSVSRKSPHQVGKAGSGHKNLQCKCIFNLRSNSDKGKWTYGPSAEAQSCDEAAHTPGLSGHWIRLTGHPFQGWFCEHSESDAAQTISLLGHKNEPVEPLGQVGTWTVEQVASHMPSEQRIILGGQEKTGVWGASDTVHRISTLSNFVPLAQSLAWLSKYVLKSAIEAAQAAIEVWHWLDFCVATQAELGHFTGLVGSSHDSVFKRSARCWCNTKLLLAELINAEKAESDIHILPLKNPCSVQIQTEITIASFNWRWEQEPSSEPPQTLPWESLWHVGGVREIDGEVGGAIDDTNVMAG